MRLHINTTNTLSTTACTVHATHKYNTQHSLPPSRSLLSWRARQALPIWGSTSYSIWSHICWLVQLFVMQVCLWVLKKVWFSQNLADVQKWTSKRSSKSSTSNYHNENVHIIIARQSLFGIQTDTGLNASIFSMKYDFLLNSRLWPASI